MVQNNPKSDLDLSDLFSGSELDWEIDSSVENAEFGDSDLDLSCLFEDESVESTSDRAQTLALSKDPFPLAVTEEEKDDGSVDMYDDEELKRKEEQVHVFESDNEELPQFTLGESEQDESEQDESEQDESEQDEEDTSDQYDSEQYDSEQDNSEQYDSEQDNSEQDNSEQDNFKQEKQEKQEEKDGNEPDNELDDETDDDDMDNGTRGKVEECWGCRNIELVKDNGLCNRCEARRFNCAMCKTYTFCDIDTGACYDCRMQMEAENKVTSESESDSDYEDKMEDVNTSVDKPAENGRWYCHDVDCNKSCGKKQDLKFHIMGDARGGHGARFDKNHPLRWRNGAVFIPRDWDPYVWKCDHCDDFNGFCKGYVNRASLVKHFKKMHPEVPLPEKRPKSPSIKRKRRLEGSSIVNANCQLQFQSHLQQSCDNSYSNWHDEPSPKRRKEEDRSKTMAI